MTRRTSEQSPANQSEFDMNFDGDSAEELSHDESSLDDGSQVPSLPTDATPSIAEGEYVSELLARRGESHRVLCSKLVVYALLIICASIISVVTHTLIIAEQEEAFKSLVSSKFKCR
jgi:hypothetical protein